MAGAFGLILDQISYSLSPVYFTHLKFKQFWFVDFGLHPRVLVSVIGVIAGFSLGLASGWFIGRLSGNAANESFVRLKRLVILVIGFGAVGAVLGATVGWTFADFVPGGLGVWRVSLTYEEYRRLIAVVLMHWGTYIGVGIGALSVALRLRSGNKD